MSWYFETVVSRVTRRLLFAEVSWPNKISLLLFLAFTIFKIVRNDTLGASEVNDMGEKEPLKGSKSNS